jgi:hypothetical protein
MFEDFDLPYIFFLISPRDGQLLYKFGKPVAAFPKVLEMTVRPEFLRQQSLFPVWLKIYQRSYFVRPRLESVVFDVNQEPEIDIPRFQRRYLILKELAVKNSCHPLDILRHKVAIRNLNLEHQEATDLNSLCRRCRENGSAGCENCSPRTISFVDFVLHRSLGELRTRASAFETFIRHRTALDLLMRFDQVSLSLLEVVLSPFCRALNNTAIDTAIKLLPTPLTRKIIYILYVLNNLRVRDGEWGEYAAELEREWSNVLSQFPVGEDLFFNRSEYTEIVGGLSIISQLPPHRRSFWLMHCLLALDRLRKRFRAGKALSKVVLVHAGTGLISAFVMMSSLFIKQDSFQALCSAAELRVWSSFEETLLDFVQMPSPKDDARERSSLSRIYEEFQDRILEQSPPPLSEPILFELRASSTRFGLRPMIDAQINEDEAPKVLSGA